MLEVRLIGTFQVLCDGNPVVISSRAAQSLFAYLILTAGKLHRREKLAGMLWPDASEEKARAYLRHELWRIRKALSSTSNSNYLHADDISISFDSSAEYLLDVTTLTSVNETGSVEDLEGALARLEGELLPGFYDEWIVQEREHLRALYEQRMTCLLELFEKDKCWRDILEWAERWISVGGASETAFRYLMIAYDALGDRAKVAASYERCVQALRELALEPSEQTRGLAFKRTPKLNIPIPLTSFIGREKEIKEVAELLSKSRLVTLTGSGGVGKTRLAIQVVPEVLAQFPDGAWFLDLASLHDSALVPNMLANMLGLHVSGELPLTELLINYFHSRTGLIMFDNCEHLIESCAPLINTLLTSCEGLSVLATSREALRVSGEVPYRVPSLELPRLDTDAAIDVLTNNESVRLFMERTLTVSPEFAVGPQNTLVVAHICHRLDGIPLAIELAAARANVLSMEQILKRLDDRFTLLAGGWRTALPRHQTLRATIEWSYNLLSLQEQILFRRLSVFANGWTLEAAESICTDGQVKADEILDLMEHLFNKSMVTAGGTQQQSRFRMLETIRQYAMEELAETGEGDILRDNHLEYFLNLAENAEPYLIRPEQIEWLHLLDTDYENLRLALERALSKESAEPSLRLCAALGRFWITRFLWKEGSNWLKRALSKPLPSLSSIEKALHAKALSQDAELASYLDDLERMTSSAEQSLKLANEVQDKRISAIAMLQMGLVMARRDHSGSARQLMEQSLTEFQLLNDVYWHACAYRWFSNLLLLEGVLKVSERNFQLLKLTRESGDRLLIASSLVSYSYELFQLGKLDEAIKCAEEADSLFKQMGSSINDSLMILMEMAWWKGEHERAKKLYTLFQEHFGIVGEKLLRSDMIADLGLLAMEEGNLEEAQEYFELALRIAQELEDQAFMSWRLAELANIYHLQNNDKAFKNAIEQSVLFAKRITNFRKIHSLVLMINTLYPTESTISSYILGAIEAFFQMIDYRVFDPRPIGHYYDAAEIHARKSLGDAAFESAFAEGQKMSLDEALDLALKTVEEM